ncbi:MAG: LpqB family beta-propeller domain-containing protein [Woeseiaceae bacterium]|nr:LpqB family beta-propeller domain-containing protein [Woeseiaceae bacterium]
MARRTTPQAACRSDDHGAVHSPGRPAVSPDGRQVAFVFRDQVYAVDTAGGTPARMTSATSAASDPQWSSDGESLWFLSDRSGTWQLWQLPVDDFGEARQVTDLERGVDSIRLSPDEKRLLLIMDDNPDSKAENGEPEPWVITRLQFKRDAGEGYLVERPSDHLYVADLASGELDTRSPVANTPSPNRPGRRTANTWFSSAAAPPTPTATTAITSGACRQRRPTARRSPNP